MDDDDEFGDLYSDVLRPISAPIQSQFKPQPPPSSSIVPSIGKEIPKAATSFADLNDSSEDDDEKDEFLGAPNFNSTAHLKPGSVIGSEPRGFDLNRASGNSDGAGFKFDLKDRVLENKNASVRLEEKGFGNSSFMDEADIDVVVEESDDKDDDFVVKDENSGGNGEKIKLIISGNGSATNVGLGQEESKIGDFLSDQIIPGISVGGISGGAEIHGNASFENDSDSDSEDDLQIVLNDTYHGPMGMEKVGGGGLMGADEEDDEDEDGDPLVIVADNDDPNNRLMITDDPEWGGEEAGIGGDGEKKEPGDVTKVSGIGGPSMAPKTGYSNHVYHHQFPSQFKYVRPGAASGPASSVGGAPGQVRPQSSMMPVVGRGRGDWRPAGMKLPPGMQKGFHADYGAQVWGSAAGRGYGIGLEFTLPSHKTIFEVDIDNFEEKPWRLQGIDVADFFNFGLNEESWKDYCKQLEQFRLEKTMQSKIRVYESARTEQDYDPDLPPELAAAAGIQDTPSESAKQGMPDDGQSDLAKGAARVRPPLPTGRAIPVETGGGERLPSTDMRKPRGIDYDAIITIKCEGSADDDESQGKDMTDHPDNDRPTQDLTDCNEFEVIRHEDTDYADHYPISRKTVNPGRRSLSPEPVDDDTPRGDGSLRLSSEVRPLDSADSRERSPVYRGGNFSAAREERREKVRPGRVRSPTLANKVSTRDKSPNDDQKEGSLESADGCRSPVARGNVADADIEHKDRVSDDEIVEVVKDFEADDKEESLTDTHDDDVISKHASKSQKLSSQVEPAFPEEADNEEEEEDSKTGRSSENSQARSGSSKDNWKRHNAVDEVRVGHSTHISSHKKLDSRDEVHMRRKVHDERQDMDRHHNAVRGGREEVYPHKGWGDPYSSGSHSLAKHERGDRRKEFDNSENVRQQRDEEIHGRRGSRAEDIRKREHHGESVSRHRGSKIQDIESEKDERQIRKQVENNNGGWRSGYERDIAVKHRDREDNHLKSRNDNIDDIHSKRRKEEMYMRREHAEREEMLHAPRETSSRSRKRERDDVFDMRRRDDLPRLRNDDQQNVRLKDDVLFQRERGERQRGDREEWHRLKKPNEEMSSSRKEKGELNGVLMRGRVSEENMWTSQSRGKDDHRNIEKEYYSKEAGPGPGPGTGRHKELPKRRDQVENNSLSQNSAREDAHPRGTQISNNSERRARHERASTRDDHASNTSADSRMHTKKHKQNPRKGKESEVLDRNSLSASKKNHQDKNSGQASDTVRLKNRGVTGSDENKHLLSKRSRDDASSGDEQPEAKRGRSKLERWTSNKERDFSVVVKPPPTSSMKTKPIDVLAVPTVPSSTSKHPSGESSKTFEDDNEHHLKPGSNEKDIAVGGGDLKPFQDNIHLDTVEKLKKRSERFKLPMPVERETTTTTVKKTETEQIPIQIPLSSIAQTEIQGDSEVKAERPARKRRWTSS